MLYFTVQFLLKKEDSVKINFTVGSFPLSKTFPFGKQQGLAVT